jgi:hypothetical protein
MSDRRAVRGFSRSAIGIDVNPLTISGRLGKLLDLAPASP